MDDAKRLSDDLKYLGGLVKRSEGDSSPFAIYLLWALMVLVGFALVDFAPRRVGVFWSIGGPLGGVASAILGYRHSLRVGQLNREEGLRHLWHWGGMMVAIGLAVPLALASVDWQALSRVILLIVALSYFLAGVHLERPLRWIGALMMAGYVALFFLTRYGWTIVGILVAVGLIVSGLLEQRRGAPAVR